MYLSTYRAAWDSQVKKHQNTYETYMDTRTKRINGNRFRANRGRVGRDGCQGVLHTAIGTRGKRMAEGKRERESNRRRTTADLGFLPLAGRGAPRHDKQNLKSIRNGQGSLGQSHQLTSALAPSRRCNLRRKAPSNEPGCWPCCVDTPARRSNHQIVRLIFNGLGSTGTGCRRAGQLPRASKRMR